MNAEGRKSQLPALKDEIVKQSMNNLRMSYDETNYRTPVQDARKDGGVHIIPVKQSMSKLQRDNALSDFYKGKKQLNTA